jgi:hypothetical protein
VSPAAERRADRVILAVLVAGTLVYLWKLRPYGLMLLDEGYWLHAAQRMLGGEVLYRDVYAHYAPLRYHLIEIAFRLARPSVLVGRTVWLALVALDVALVYRVARRLAPPAVAWAPAALLALAPGPWTKAFFNLSQVACALALARALERPTARRAFVLGAVVGAALLARQDVGLVQLAIALAAAPLPLLLPERFGAAPTGRPAARAGAVALGAALVVAPALAFYATHGALGALVDSTLVRAFTQRSAYGSGLPRLLTRFGVADEGRIAGALLLLPLAILPAAGLAWLARLRRSGLDARGVLLAALLASGVASLTNAYYQLRVLRLLQSIAPYSLLATWLAAAAVREARRRLGALAAGAVAGAGIAAAAAFAWAVLLGVPAILPGEEYSGSLRAARYATPVSLLGDTVYTDPQTADQIRLLRAFVGRRVPPSEPIFVAPLESEYYALLERPNALWMQIDDYLPGDFLLTDAEKREQMRRLLDSRVQVAVADGAWLLSPGLPDAVRRTLLEEFHPVRWYGNSVVLERGRDADAQRLLAAEWRATYGRPAAGDAPLATSYAARHPDEPWPHEALAFALARQGEVEAAIGELESAARLDPANAALREYQASLLLARGRKAEAAAALDQAAAIRESPAAQALRAQIRDAR